MSEGKNNNLPRRRFLKLGVGVVGGALGLGYLGLAGDFLIPPSDLSKPLQEVGKIGDFSVGSPTLVAYQGSGGSEGVYVTNLGDNGWLALDFHCTHLQCPVNWYDATKQYICPCHGGTYDINGNVLGGPPPHPLPRRIIKIQGDSVLVGGRLV